jgi:hypothetical protein
MEQQKRREDAHALRKSRECRTKQNQRAPFCCLSLNTLAGSDASRQRSQFPKTFGTGIPIR